MTMVNDSMAHSHALPLDAFTRPKERSDDYEDELRQRLATVNASVLDPSAGPVPSNFDFRSVWRVEIILSSNKILHLK
jgi:hypothetical protein